MTPDVNPVTIQQGAYDALKSAVLGSGLNSPIVSKYYEPERNAVAARGMAAPNIYNTKVQVDYEERQAEEARQAAARAAKAQDDEKAKLEADMANPSKYKRVPGKDGGYSFVAPDGTQLSAWEYSRIKGISPADAVKKSGNPIDSGFQNDYKNLESFLTAVRNNDKKKLDKYYTANPGLKNYEKNLPKLYQDFQSKYPTIFGGNKSGRQPTNQTFIPSKDSQPRSTGGGFDVGKIFQQTLSGLFK